MSKNHQHFKRHTINFKSAFLLLKFFSIIIIYEAFAEKKERLLTES